MQEAGGVSVVVHMILSQDKVLQRFVEQIIDDSRWAWTGFNSASWSRPSKRGSGGAALRRDQFARAVKISTSFFFSR